MAQAPETTRPKLPLVRIPSDGCTVSLGRTLKDGKIDNPGIPHKVHLGEHIEVLPTLAMSEYIALARVRQCGIGGATVDEMEANLNRLCLELSKRVIAWDWTDMMGQPYPQPYGHPEVLAQLTTDELVYLMDVAPTTESGDDRKNA